MLDTAANTRDGTARNRKDNRGDGHRTVAPGAASVVCIGVTKWKREAVSDLLTERDVPPVFVETIDEAIAAAQGLRVPIACWATREPATLAQAAAAAGIEVFRIEDGFLRSVGLGADLVPPCSLVIDRSGIYYDASRPNDLETLLRTTQFDDPLIDRAKRLRKDIVKLRLTKYNVDQRAASLRFPDDRTVVFVPGQVEDDASVRLGSPNITTNLALLNRVRRDWPDAFIVFKPHPDIDAGYRAGNVSNRKLLTVADAVVRGASTVDLIERSHVVATMTSLVGFEALLRERTVVTYGKPFYAGWGLTVDHDATAGRSRRLQIDELVAGSLILYPRYRDPDSGKPCSPEHTVQWLRNVRRARRGWSTDPASLYWLASAFVRRQFDRSKRTVVREHQRSPK